MKSRLSLKMEVVPNSQPGEDVDMGIQRRYMQELKSTAPFGGQFGELYQNDTGKCCLPL